MDKRYFLMIIIIVLSMMNLYVVMNNSDVVGTASVSFGDYIFTSPNNFDLLTKRSYSKEQVNKLALLKDDICIEKSGGGEKTPVGRAVIFDKNNVR